MKKLLLLVVLAFSASQIWSQMSVSSNTDKKVVEEDRNFRIPLIGETAPSFTAESTNGVINFPTDFGHKWKLLFSHPQDFTPVCSTEIMELAYLQDAFDKLNVKVVVVSADPLDTHIQWKKAMESLNLGNRGLAKIKFPLVDDENVTISKEYGMIHPATNSTRSVRGVFVIDPDNVIQAIYFYPMNIGRNTKELLRVISALQIADRDKVLTPVNWEPGNDVLVHNLPKKDDKNEVAIAKDYYSPVWFLLYKKANSLE